MANGFGEIDIDMLTNSGVADLSIYDPDSYGHSEIPEVSGSNGAGAESALGQTLPSSFLWTNNVHGDQEQVLGLHDERGINSSVLNIGFEATPEYPVYSGRDFMTWKTFKRPTITNDEFPPTSGQPFSMADLASESSSISHNIDFPAMKKRKRTAIPEFHESTKNDSAFDVPFVLKLLFKYIQCLTDRVTIELMENIAEDVDCSLEYVIGSYVQYARAGNRGTEFLDRLILTGHSTFAVSEKATGGMIVGSSKGKEAEVLSVNEDASKEVQMWDEKAVKSQEINHTTSDKPFRCDVSSCNEAFSRQGDLNRHSKKHRPGEHPCTFPDCDKIFYRKDKLRQHWKKEHKNSSQPSNLISTRPKRDDNQDGKQDDDSLSDGSNRGEGSMQNKHCSNQSSESRNSDTPGSSSSNRTSSDHNGSSRSVGRESETDMDSKNIDSENDVDVGIFILQSSGLVQPSSTQKLPEDSSHIEGNQNPYQGDAESPNRIFIGDPVNFVGTTSKDRTASLANHGSGTPPSLFNPTTASNTPSTTIVCEQLAAVSTQHNNIQPPHIYPQYAYWQRRPYDLPRPSNSMTDLTNQDNKPRLSKSDVEVLERQFQKQNKPSSNIKRQLAAKMGINIARINNWFQNRRAKAKHEKKQALYEIESLRSSDSPLPEQFNPSEDLEIQSRSPDNGMATYLTSDDGATPTVSRLQCPGKKLT